MVEVLRPPWATCVWAKAKPNVGNSQRREPSTTTRIRQTAFNNKISCQRADRPYHVYGLRQSTSHAKRARWGDEHASVAARVAECCRNPPVGGKKCNLIGVIQLCLTSGCWMLQRREEKKHAIERHSVAAQLDHQWILSVLSGSNLRRNNLDRRIRMMHFNEHHAQPRQDDMPHAVLCCHVAQAAVAIKGDSPRHAKHSATRC
mmetsp:Transcript_93950/g.254990  ORF Transcript_93950/g.254990 Transcript_93950/m.254990 type:complete len:203 (-) Transcript_93950:82-690(-)